MKPSLNAKKASRRPTAAQGRNSIRAKREPKRYRRGPLGRKLWQLHDRMEQSTDALVFRPRDYKVVSLRECPMENPIIEQAAHAAAFWREHITKAPWIPLGRECLCVLLLNSRRRLIGYELVSIGSLDSVMAHPADVFRAAIIAGAGTIILLHNHPSGDPSPSDGDIKVTRDLIRSGQLNRIDLLDHVIMGRPEKVGGRDYASLRELGYFF